MPVGKKRQCYICYSIQTEHILNGIPVCPRCMDLYMEGEPSSEAEEEGLGDWEEVTAEVDKNVWTEFLELDTND